MIPRWYAVAYRDFDRDCKACYPIPLHFFVRWERDLRFWLMRAGRPGYRERIEAEYYRKGLNVERAAHHRQEALVGEWAYKNGFEDGRRKAIDDGLAALNKRGSRE